MSGEYVVRPYTEADLEAVRDLHDRSLRGLAAHLHTADEFDRMKAKKADDGFARDLAAIHFYVAVAAGGSLIATAGWGEQEQPRLARIREVFVDPGWSRRGVATRLLRLVETDAANHGRDVLWLMSSTVAVPFYEALGYVKGAEDASGTLPAVRMEKFPGLD